MGLVPATLPRSLGPVPITALLHLLALGFGRGLAFGRDALVLWCFLLLLLEVLDAQWLGELGLRFAGIPTFDFNQNCTTTELLNQWKLQLLGKKLQSNIYTVRRCSCEV
jgi:hypothetical protein